MHYGKSHCGEAADQVRAAKRGIIRSSDVSYGRGVPRCFFGHSGGCQGASFLGQPLPKQAQKSGLSKGAHLLGMHMHNEETVAILQVGLA